MNKPEDTPDEEFLLDFDSDEPLEGGVCDMDGGCESCQ